MEPNQTPPVQNIETRKSPTYLFTITLAILSLAVGVVGTYYWSLQQQLALTGQILAVYRPIKRALPFSPRITAPTSTDIIYKNIPFKISWTPLRLKEGEVVQVWMGHTSGTMAGLEGEKNVKFETGSHEFVIDNNFWRYVKPTYACQKADIRIDIGHYEKTGPGVLDFITQSSMTIPVSVSESTSTPQPNCVPDLIP